MNNLFTCCPWSSVIFVWVIFIFIGLIFIAVSNLRLFFLKGLRIMFEGLKLFLDLCYVYNIFKTNLVQKYVIGGLKSNVNIELKLELVTTYHKGFVVKLL